MEPFSGIYVLAILVLLFLVLRVIVLWYWRINEGIALLKSIDEKLGRLAGRDRSPETWRPLEERLRRRFQFGLTRAYVMPGTLQST
jgi:hypothetical protein